MKKKRLAELEGIKEEMAEVSNWQEEIADLDKCIAWCEALELRAEVQQQRDAIGERLPKELAEVSVPSALVYTLAFSPELDLQAAAFSRLWNDVVAAQTHDIDTLFHDVQLKAKLDEKAAEVAQANVDLAEKVISS